LAVHEWLEEDSNGQNLKGYHEWLVPADLINSLAEVTVFNRDFDDDGFRAESL